MPHHRLQLGLLCSSSTTGDNAVQVLETGVIDTWFIRMVSIFGVNSAPDHDHRGRVHRRHARRLNAQYNVAILIDTTDSMDFSDNDANCGNTRIYCALQGVQILLQSLSPCGPSSTTGQLRSL